MCVGKLRESEANGMGEMCVFNDHACSFNMVDASRSKKILNKKCTFKNDASSDELEQTVNKQV